MLRIYGLFGVLAAILASGCAYWNGDAGLAKRETTQSALNYLYPDGADPSPSKRLTALDLPLRVAISFVPSQGRAQLPRSVRQKVLREFAAAFEQQNYVGSIQVLPEGTLRPSGGYADLAQAAVVHNFDVVALLSYDQVAYVGESPLSLFDLTIVGAFVVPAHGTDLYTNLSASVLHVPSQRYLLGASGEHHRKGVSTLARIADNLRTDQIESLAQAADALATDMYTNLDRFREHIKRDPSLQTTGAGALGSPAGMAMVLLLLGLCLWRRA
ncbi:MAG: rhombotarget lipoprotein [Pseudomonadota bacterium]